MHRPAHVTNVARGWTRTYGKGKRMAHGYETDRLDLPFVGQCTFGKRPPVTDWGQIDADVAVLGIPYDMGTQ